MSVPRDRFYRFGVEEPILPDPVAAPLRPAFERPRPPTARAGPPGVRERFVTAARSSRVSVELARAYEPRWRAPVPDLAPACVLAARDRILATGSARWQLFSADGKMLGWLGAAGLATVEGDRFHSTNALGYLAARRLEDGKQDHVLSPRMGTSYLCQLVVPLGPRLLVAWTELPPHRIVNRAPEWSLVELYELGDTKALDSDLFLTEARCVSALMTPRLEMLPAFAAGTLALAYDRRLYFLDESLAFRGAYSFEARPLGLSLDETANAYLVVRRAGGEVEEDALIATTPSGELLLEAALPELAALPVPPVVGHSHRVFVLGRTGVLAVDAPGRIAWRHSASQVAGAVVTPDDTLVLAAGGEIVAVDPAGSSRVLFTGTEPWRTPPSFTETGDLVLATAREVFCLGPC